MSVLAEQLLLLGRGQALSAADCSATISALLDEHIPLESAKQWLLELNAVGLSVDEIYGAAQAMRARSIRVVHDCPLLLDVCGTGGDGLHTINISTAVAFVVAACGLPVAKHGNRAASSRCGSADVLEALGVDLRLTPAQAQAQLASGGVAFLFAQQYHPALQTLAPLRKAIGTRTIFNLLGPLINPAQPTHQLIGVADPALLLVMAQAARRLGVQAGAIVNSEQGLDEISGDSPTRVLSFRGDAFEEQMINPADYGIHTPLTALRGGDARENAAALLAILSGRAELQADVVALNAAVALWVAGQVDSIAAGVEQARSALASGRAMEHLARLQQLKGEARDG